MALSIDDFLQQVRAEVEFRSDSYSHAHESKDWSFTQWVLELLFPSVDPDEAFNLLAEDSGNAWNINASYRDEESGTFFLICARYADEPKQTRLGPGLVYSLLDAHKKVVSDVDGLAPSQSVLGAAARALRDGYSLSVVLASLGELDDSIDLNQVRKTYSLEQQQFVYYDLYQLRRIYAGLEEEETQSITLPFLSHAEYDGPVDAVVGNVTASDLAGSLSGLVPQIYDVNLRAPLGSTKINKQMRETLSSPNRNLFWYYNNGITILCTDFKRESDRDSSFVVESPRIVNGAQTTDTILSANPDEIAQVHLMVRLIAALPSTTRSTDETGDQANFLQDLYLDIARYTNSQNPIEMPDFRSNEEVQKRLHDKFAELGWFYERRRGQWENYPDKDRFKKDGKTRRIKMVELAQRWFAFDGQPATAIRERLSLFEEQGHYGSIFMLARSAEEYLLAYLLFEQIQERLKAKIKKAKEEERIAAETDSKISFSARNYLVIGRATKLAAAHMTALLGIALQERYGTLTRDLAERVLLSTENGDLVGNVYAELEDTLFRITTQLPQEKYKTLHRYLSETDTLDELYDMFTYVLERESAKGRDILAI